MSIDRSMFCDEAGYSAETPFPHLHTYSFAEMMESLDQKREPVCDVCGRIFDEENRRWVKP